MTWTCDPNKSHVNKLKHTVSFETAERAFDDPLHVTNIDPFPYEERYRTIGMVEGTLILVVHTLADVEKESSSESGRIISARKPTRHERATYEEFQQ